MTKLDTAGAPAREKRSFDRFVNFSDGVFAIAITLLVLDVRMPSMDATAMAPPLGPQLASLMPNLFAFMLSFVVIGGYWVAHNGLFKLIDRSDIRLVWLNLLVLFFIVLLPLPTQIVADYGNTTLGVEIYAGAMTLTGLSILALTAYAKHAHLTAPEADVGMSMMKSALTPLVFASSMVVAIWSPTWATNMWWLVAVAFFVVDPIINSNWRNLTLRKGSSH
jgi:uncharacterized membrane protein